MKIIELTQGKFTVVDDDVYEWASKLKWWALVRPSGLVHAVRQERRKTIYLHREISGVPTGVKTDHKDGDGLNNLRDNLRPATSQQNNSASRRKAKEKTSKFRGVSWQAHANKWTVRITQMGKVYYLGNFLSEEAAARAYDIAATELCGEFASLNFPK